MNLLLLLSALLSALTGGASAMRTPAAAHAVAQAAVAIEARALPARSARRPQQSLPSLIVSAVCDGMAVTLSLSAIAPLYASRRRE